MLATAKAFVEVAEAGYTASELENVLSVEVKHPLLELMRRGLIRRWKVSRNYVYVSCDDGKRRQQRLMREDREAYAGVGMGLEVEVLPDEVKAAIVLFFSVLDEQQRRLYAGLEAAKLGHGGDRRIAELLGLDAHTVAKGRREVFEGTVKRERIREKGGGRKRVEKKRRE
ncbi:MAG: hypothetical protein QME81_15200 [bacterium]|nr:hypothetical protein [bacterium]